MSNVHRMEKNLSVIPSKLALQHIWNEYSPHLSDGEMRVLTFIYMRTIAFSKEHELIPYRHFLKGVKTRDRLAFATAPIRKSKRQIQRILADLVGKGLLIITESTPAGNRYAINLILTSAKLAEITQICDRENLHKKAKGCKAEELVTATDPS